MKVVVVASKFAPHAGGTAVVWTQWCLHWPAEVLTVIAPKIHGAREFDRRSNFSTLRVAYPNIPKIRMPWLWLAMAWRLFRLCLVQRPSLIHYGHVFENGFMGPILKRLLGVPYCVHTYGEELVLASRLPLLRGLVAWVLREASVVTTISKYTEGWLARFGYHGAVLMAHPGVNTDVYRPGLQNGVLSRLGVPQGPVLLTLGRLMRRKGHARILRILPNLLATHPRLQYVIAGVGPEEANLRKLVAELNLTERVHFLGRVPDQDLPALLCEATVFAHPNYATEQGDVEGFGIVFLEAAACGIPVVGGNSGGVPDSVRDGTTGFLVGEDEGELLARIQQLLADAPLRERMGLDGRNWALQFQWGLVARRVWEHGLSALRP